MDTRHAEHVKHTCLGMFDMFGVSHIGGWGAKHIKHAQTSVFDVFEGGCRMGEVPNTKTHPSGLVFVFGRCSGAGA